MGDYPDYTDVMQIIGSDIMVPFDIQGAYIMMPVDLQAQYITLDINIKAATVEQVNVDLVAQTVGNIGIDIKANTLGNLVIDIEAQSVGIYLQPDWQAAAGKDKNFHTDDTNVATGGTIYGDYAPGTGKTLYICGMSFYIYGYAAADRDKDQMGVAFIQNLTGPVVLAALGGNGGGAIPFPKPLLVSNPDSLRYIVYNLANHNCDIGITVWGYEI